MGFRPGDASRSSKSWALDAVGRRTRRESSESMATTPMHTPSGRRGGISGPLKVGPAAKPKPAQVDKQPQVSSQPSFVSVDSGDGARWYVSRIIYSESWEFFIGAVLIFNFALIVQDTDARALAGPTPSWIRNCGDACLVIYVLELSGRVAVERHQVFRTAWNNLDILVVLSGLAEKFLDLTGHRMNTSTGFTMLRTVRILRLLRAVRIMAAVRELRKLIQMMMLCLRTLFWSLVLAFLLMTIWSVLMVELVHPFVQELEAVRAMWHGNEEWTHAFSSVMRANLTLFQTIVAGDSWGSLSVPIIEHYPMTAFIFVPAHVTLVFGVLNLIVVVLVDTFAEVRERDVTARLAEKEVHEREEKKELLKIFHSIDTDGSGALTLGELEAAARCDPDLSARLRVMDVGNEDLQRLFSILDADGSGEIDPQEFMDVMYRLKYSDSQASITIMKHLLEDLSQRQHDSEGVLQWLRSNVFQVRQEVQILTHRGELGKRLSTPSDSSDASEGGSPRLPRLSCAHFSCHVQLSDSWGAGTPLNPHRMSCAPYASNGWEAPQGQIACSDARFDDSSPFSSSGVQPDELPSFGTDRSVLAGTPGDAVPTTPRSSRALRERPDGANGGNTPVFRTEESRLRSHPSEESHPRAPTDASSARAPRDGVRRRPGLDGRRRPPGLLQLLSPRASPVAEADRAAKDAVDAANAALARKDVGGTGADMPLKVMGEL